MGSPNRRKAEIVRVLAGLVRESGYTTPLSARDLARLSTNVLQTLSNTAKLWQDPDNATWRDYVHSANELAETTPAKPSVRFATDGVSILGDGTAGNPLKIGRIDADGGTF